MDHLVVLLRRALRQLEQRPDVVEEIDGELTALLLRQRRAAVAGVVAHRRRSYAIPSFELHQQGDGRRSGNGRCSPCDLEREQRAMSDVTAPSGIADPGGAQRRRARRAPAAARAGRAVGLAAPHDVAHPDRLRARGRLRLDRPRARAARDARGDRAGAVGAPPRAPRADRRAPRRAQPPPHLDRALRRGVSAAYSAMTNFGTTVDQASTTSSCISSRLIASSRTWTQLKRMFEASGRENFSGSDSTSASRSSFGNENPITVWSWENASQTIWPTRNLSRP